MAPGLPAPRARVLAVTLLLLRSPGPCAFNLSVCWVTPSSFLQLCLIPHRHPDSFLPPNTPSSFLPWGPAGRSLCHQLPVADPPPFQTLGHSPAFSHLYSLAKCVWRTCFKPGPALSPHCRTVLSVCIVFLAEVP